MTSSPPGIEANGAFPATMVDRIVPATTDADIAEVARLIGVEDAARHRRALPAMGDRGCLRQRPPGLARRRRPDGLRGRTLSS